MYARKLSLRALVGVVSTLVLVSTTVVLAAAGDPPQPRTWKARPEVSERSGSSGAGWFSGWTANSEERPQHYNAYLRENDSGGRWRLNAPGTQAEFGNFSGRKLTFSQRRPGRPGNLYVGDAYGPFRVPFPPKVNTPANELHPTLGGPWLLFTRSQARSGHHKVMLYNRETQRLRSLVTVSGRKAVYAGQVRGDYASWYTWGPEHSDVFRYRISTKKAVKLPRPSAFTRQYGSSVGADGTVYYHRRKPNPCRRGATELMTYPRGGSAEVLHSYPAGRTGERTVLSPPTMSRKLIYTVRKCGVPQARATDLYSIRVAANPPPEPGREVSIRSETLRLAGPTT